MQRIQDNYIYVEVDPARGANTGGLKTTTDPAYAENAGCRKVEVGPPYGANTGDLKTATDPVYAGNTKMDNDLTCEEGMHAGEDRETAFNGTAAISAVTKQHDQDYAVLHDGHNTVASSNDTTQNDGSLTHTTVDQIHDTKINHPSHSATIAKSTDYGVINQPQIDDLICDTDKPTDEAEYGVVNQPLS